MDLILNENFTRKRKLAFREDLYSWVKAFQKFREGLILWKFVLAKISTLKISQNFSIVPSPTLPTSTHTHLFLLFSFQLMMLKWDFTRKIKAQVRFFVCKFVCLDLLEENNSTNSSWNPDYTEIRLILWKKATLTL